VLDLDSFADGNAECCLSKPPAAEVLALLKRETLKCVPDHLGKLMADHAPKDWRPLLRRTRLTMALLTMALLTIANRAQCRL